MRVYSFHKNESETISFKVFVTKASSVEPRTISVRLMDSSHGYTGVQALKFSKFLQAKIT